MPAAGHLCQFVTIGDGSTEITLVKLNNGAAMARPTDTDTERARGEGLWDARTEGKGARRQASSKCNAVPCRAARFLAPGIGQKW